MSIGAKAGGSGNAPESTRTLSDGLAWSNFQGVISLNPTASGDGARRQGTIECMRAEEELGGLIITCLIALFATELLRQMIRFGLMCYKKDPSGVEALLFPRWHFVVLQAQFLGLAQSAGAAMTSPCPGYVAFGIIVFLMLFSFTAMLTYLLWQGIRRRLVVFEAQEQVPFFQAIKIAFSTKVEAKGIWGKLKAKKAVLDELRTRGEWVEPSSEESSDNRQGAESITVQGRAFGDDSQTLTQNNSGPAYPLSPPPGGPGDAPYQLDSAMVYADPSSGSTTPAHARRKSSLSRALQSFGDSLRAFGASEPNDPQPPENDHATPASKTCLPLAIQTEFLGKLGPMFTDFVEKRWWYVSWCMMRNLMTGLFLGVIKPTVPNSAIITLIYVFDFVFVGGFFPHADKWTNLVEGYTLMTRCLSLGCVTAYMDGRLLPDQLTNGAKPFPPFPPTISHIAWVRV